MPPAWVWITVAVCMAIIAWVRRPDVRPAVVESGAANLVVYLMVFVAMLTQIIWFTFSSGHRLLVRLVPVLALVVGVLVAISSFEVAGWSGAMVPKFRLRGTGNPDQRLELPPGETTEMGVDLATTTTGDFPQFLGPQRRLVVDHIKLEREWQSNPPQELWRQPIGAGWSAFAAVNGYAVTMEQRGPIELVTCYEVASGVMQWSHGIETRHEDALGGVGPRSTPTIDEGRVYALGATGVLRCLDGSTGQPIWVHDLPAMYGLTPEEDKRNVAWGRAASPLVVDSMVVAPVGGPREGRKVSLVAFDKTTGEPVWEGGQQQVGYSSPSLATIHDTRQILIVNESSVSGHATDTGDELWRQPWPGSSNAQPNASQAVAVGADRILVSKGYGAGAALFQVTLDSGQWGTEPIWDGKVLKTKLTNVVIHEEHAYALDDGILSCVVVETGRRRWKRGRYGHGQILLVGDVLLVLAESGELLMVEPTPKGHEVLGRLPVLDGITWNNLCLYGARLLVRNAEEAACYELPLPAQQQARQGLITRYPRTKWL